MKRREFLRTAGGAAGAATASGAAAGPAAADGGVLAAQEGDEGSGAGDGVEGNESTGSDDGADGNESEGGGLPGAGETQTIAVGPGGEFIFDPDEVEVLPGTTVVWEWESNNHNVEPTAQPDGADWPGEIETYNSGHSYQYTFTVEGTYDYVCRPHIAQDMEGTVIVTEDANQGGGGGGYEPPEPAQMGIPIQKHFVGALAFMGIFVTLVFTFYVLKYGESAHTAAPNKRD